MLKDAPHGTCFPTVPPGPQTRGPRMSRPEDAAPSVPSAPGPSAPLPRRLCHPDLVGRVRGRTDARAEPRAGRPRVPRPGGGRLPSAPDLPAIRQGALPPRPVVLRLPSRPLANAPQITPRCCQSDSCIVASPRARFAAQRRAVAVSCPSRWTAAGATVSLIPAAAQHRPVASMLLDIKARFQDSAGFQPPTGLSRCRFDLSFMTARQ